MYAESPGKLPMNWTNNPEESPYHPSNTLSHAPSVNWPRKLHYKDVVAPLCEMCGEVAMAAPGHMQPWRICVDCKPLVARDIEQVRAIQECFYPMAGPDVTEDEKPTQDIPNFPPPLEPDYTRLVRAYSETRIQHGTPLQQTW